MSNPNENEQKTDYTKEVNKAKASSSVGIFTLFLILAIIVALLMIIYFFLHFVNW